MTDTDFSDLPAPLHWPDAFYKPPKRIWFSGPYHGYSAVEKGIAEQLLARPQLPDARWGTDALATLVGQRVCKAVQREYEWPNDRFLPKDPFNIVCMLPFDDLEVAEVALELEEQCGVKIADEELHGFDNKTLGEFVDWLVEKVHRSQP